VYLSLSIEKALLALHGKNTFVSDTRVDIYSFRGSTLIAGILVDGAPAPGRPCHDLDFALLGLVHEAPVSVQRGVAGNNQWNGDEG